MRVNIILLLVVLMVTCATALSQVAKPAQCAPLKKVAGKCICYATSKPVCGTSGKTHKNVCLAACSGDKVKHQGPCYSQCKKTTKKNLKCINKKYGGFGTRKWCCTSYTVCWGKDCTTTKKSCGWSGKAVIRYNKHKCFWNRVGSCKYTKVKKCCKWTHVCHGSSCRNTKKICTHVKKETKKPFRKCTVVVYGQGKRKKCCTGILVTIVKKGGQKRVYKKKVKCTWSGPTVTYKNNKICKWKKSVATSVVVRRQCRNIAKKYDHVIRYLSATELRARALKRCKHSNKFVFYSCVFDESKGLLKNKKEYEKVAKYLKKKKGGYRKCYSAGDPHIKTFSGRGFNVYHKQYKKRTVYKHGDMEVSTDIEFHKKWSTRGVNVAAYVKCGKKTWHALGARKNKFKKCSKFNGIKASVRKTVGVYVYQLSCGETKVQVNVYKRGYVNVYVTAPTAHTYNCKGDCCDKPTAHIIKDHGITFKFGDPYKVKFSKACSRKTHATKFCAKRYKKQGHNAIAACIRRYSKNYKKKVVTKVVIKRIRQCKNLPVRFDVESKFFSANQLRARALKRCKHANKFVFYSCVYDESKGFLKAKAQYTRIADWLKSSSTKIQKCYSSGDPHIRTFQGRGYNVYNIQQKGRLVFQNQKGNIKVTSNIKFSKWGKRGVNVAAFVTIDGKKWSIAAPTKGKYHKCGGNGLKPVVAKSKTANHYTFTSGKIIIKVTVNKRGFINIYVTGSAVDVNACKGDCCYKAKVHKSLHGKVTFRWGNPFKVKFSSACSRKLNAYKKCRKHKKLSAALKCLRVYSKNYKKIAYTVTIKGKKVKKYKKSYIKLGHHGKKVIKKTIKVYAVMQKTKKVITTQKGKRYQCCVLKYKCYNQTCKLIKRTCKWTTTTVFKKRHFKCKVLKYGKHGMRKRCCVSFSRCTHKGCKTTYKRCYWAGCVSWKWRKSRCQWKVKSKQTKQQWCCKYTRFCKGYKCHNHQFKCKWFGKIIKTKYVHGCKSRKYGRFGIRSWCCRHTHKCTNGKCKKIRSKCKWTGKVTIIRKHNRCHIKLLSKNTKCNYCCSWTHRCVGNKCKKENKQCACKGKVTKWWLREKCTLKKISKNTKQTQCCTWKKTCYGKKVCKKHCKTSKKVCHYVGFPIVTTKHKKCVWKMKSSNAKQLYCCHHSKTCRGHKCKTKKHKCFWKGLIIKKIKYNKCKWKVYKCKTARRKYCCSYIKKCRGTFCKVQDKHCDWKGIIIVKKFHRKVIYKKFCKNAVRKWVCTWWTVQKGVSKPVIKQRKCKWKGFAIYTHKRVTIVWKWKAKNIKQKYMCKWTTKCVNNHCKTVSAKRCRYIGKVIKYTNSKYCKLVSVGKHAKRERCTYWKKICVDAKCKVVHKVQKWKGKVITTKTTLVCKWKVDKKKDNKKHRYCCRHVLRCYGRHCKNIFAPSCYYSFSRTVLKKKECKWVFVKPPTPKLYLKRKKCKYFTKVCHSKKGCRNVNVKFKWVGKVIKKHHFVKCVAKFFGTNHKRRYCCHKTTSCHGSKCHTHTYKCNWKGVAWKVKGIELFRWKTVCKDVISKADKEGKQVRLQCCKVYQKCEKLGGFFKCSLVKKGKCWWSGAARGDVHIYENGKWVELNVKGTVTYVKDAKIGVYTQISKTGDGTSITEVAIAFPVTKNVLTLKSGVNGALVVSHNGKVTAEKSFTFGANHVVVTGNKVSVARDSESIEFVLSEGIFELGVQVNIGEGAEGLFVTGTSNPKQHQISEKLSSSLGFTKYLEYGMVIPRKAMHGVDPVACCSSLKSDERRKECESDTKNTGKCFLKHYQDSDPVVSLIKH